MNWSPVSPCIWVSRSHFTFHPDWKAEMPKGFLFFLHAISPSQQWTNTILSNILNVLFFIQRYLCENFKLYGCSCYLGTICCVPGPVPRCEASTFNRALFQLFLKPVEAGCWTVNSTSLGLLGLGSHSPAFSACDFGHSDLPSGLVVSSVKQGR